MRRPDVEPPPGCVWCDCPECGRVFSTRHREREMSGEMEWPLDKVKRLLKAATPGPWRTSPTPSGMVRIEPGIGWAVPGVHGESAATANAELIAEAPLLLAWLVREIEAAAAPLGTETE